MAGEKQEESGKDLFWKVIAYTLLVVVVFFIGKAIYNAIKTAEANKDANYKSSGNQPGTSGYDPDKPTLSQEQAKAIVQLIIDSVHEYWKNNDTQLQNAFKQIQNDADFLMVKDAFGSQPYHGGLVAWPWDPTYTLGDYIRQAFKDKVWQGINADLKNRGLTEQL